jgi:hypothetical protein
MGVSWFNLSDILLSDLTATVVAKTLVVRLVLAVPVDLPRLAHQATGPEVFPFAALVVRHHITASPTMTQNVISPHPVTAVHSGDQRPSSRGSA